MLGLIFWVAAGAIVLFLAPPLVPGQYRNWFVQNTLRAVGLVIIGFGVFLGHYWHGRRRRLLEAVEHSFSTGLKLWVDGENGLSFLLRRQRLIRELR